MITLDEAIKKASEKTNLSVGELTEHFVHRTLKYLINEDETYHEQRINKKIVDIYDGKMIYEIQTKGFKKLIDKLEVLLPNYQVTIIYPLIENKKIITLTSDNEIIKQSRSPQKGYLVHSLIELYQIRKYLDHPHLQIKVMMIDITEFKELTTKSKATPHGIKRINQHIERINKEISLKNSEDCIKLLPDIENPFTAKFFYKECHIRERKGSFILSFGKYYNKIIKVGNIGRNYLYKYQ